MNKPNNRKEKTLGQLKKDLWQVFSKFIRERDKYTCVTCGIINKSSGMHAGHYIPKSIGGLSLYFHEKNVHAQCFRCNLHLSGNWPAYRLYILRRYGEQEEQHLHNLKQTIFKPSREWYLEKINHYQSLL